VLVITTSLTSDTLRYLHPGDLRQKDVFANLASWGSNDPAHRGRISHRCFPRQIVPLASRGHGIIACCVLVALHLRPLREEGHANRICRQPAGLFPFRSGPGTSGQSAHLLRLHRPPLRHDSVCSGKPGDEPA
jgi:hypothetical protein